MSRTTDAVIDMMNEEEANNNWLRDLAFATNMTSNNLQTTFGWYTTGAGVAQ